MNTRSIKFRLTFWYSLAILASIIVIFASFFLITSQTLFTQTDSTLVSHATSIIEVINSKASNEYEMIPQNAFINQYSEVPGMLVLIFDKNGEIISSSLQNNYDKKNFLTLFNKTKSSDKPIVQNQKIGSQSMRVFATNLMPSNRVILVAHPIEVIEKSLQNLAAILIISFIILMIPTIIIGKLLAEKVVKPIDLLNEALKRERQFISDLAHELKTPLATLRSNIEVGLSKERNKEEYKKTLEETLEDASRVSETLKNILDLAWSQADIVNEIVNLSMLTKDLQEIAAKMAFQKQITINFSIEPNVTMLGKQEKLSRAILNILDNAIKYSPKKGKINISLIKNKNKAVLKIIDGGAGIAQKDLPYIFERFYRGSKTDNTLGSGLGLAIAKSIIISHHGTIDVQSRVSKGTTFKLSFPLIKS